MKKIRVSWVLLAILAVIVLPVLVTQLAQPEGRRLSGVVLADTQYAEISFRNTAQEIDLGGMLFVPEGEGPFPAVVVIHGSGTSHRENRWYLTLTQYLQERGVAVLLPDKRGSEKSQGDWRNASFEDLATDTLAALEYLREQDRFTVTKAGVIGMSQGGWIAPIVASQSSDLAFLVSFVGAAVTPKQQLLYEENYNLRQMGFLPGISNLVAIMSTSYIRGFVLREFYEANDAYDPLPYWQQLTIDALSLFGRDDTNVPSVDSAARLEALENQRIRIRIFDGSGHALADPVDRGDSIIREDALEEIREFIRAAPNRPLESDSRAKTSTTSSAAGM